MKLFAYLIPLLLVIGSCKKDVESNPPLEKKYGEGMYIGTDNGVSFMMVLQLKIKFSNKPMELL